MKTIRKSSLPACLILYGFCAPAVGAEVVAQYHGSGDAYTPEFDVKAPWLLTWRVSSDYPDSVGFELSLVDATTRMIEGRIKKFRGTTGNGFRLFTETGRYRFRVNSSFAKWYLRVEEISKEEAEELVPSSRPASPLFR